MGPSSHVSIQSTTLPFKCYKCSTFLIYDWNVSWRYIAVHQRFKQSNRPKYAVFLVLQLSHQRACLDDPLILCRSSPIMELSSTVLLLMTRVSGDAKILLHSSSDQFWGPKGFKTILELFLKKGRYLLPWASSFKSEPNLSRTADISTIPFFAFGDSL